ncbi:MAG: hypothetical protein ACI85K_002394, partial [Hyphomicrobiaceae bacterium]
TIRCNRIRSQPNTTAKTTASAAKAITVGHPK